MTRPSCRHKPCRVLLAEDNEITALLATKFIEKLGGTLDRAKGGEEAFALASEAFSDARPGYDLVLMDIRMPALDGLEARRRASANSSARSAEPNDAASSP